MNKLKQALQLRKEGHPAFEDPEHYWFVLEASGDYLYGSPYRPAWLGFGSSLGMEYETVDAGPGSFVFSTEEPVPPETLDALQLVPVCYKARRRYVIDMAKGKELLTIATEDGSQMVVIGPSARKGTALQLSTFSKTSGPLSHSDHDTMEDAVKRMDSRFCVPLSRNTADRVLCRWTQGE